MRAGFSESAAELASAQAFVAGPPEDVEARAIRADGPGPDAETLRSAYLGLLKLCLCDLGGAGTTSVGVVADGTVMSRELRGEALRLRVAGLDWPLHGLTMIGLTRLDDLQACVETVVADGVEGDLIEAGVWRGGAGLLMRATLDSLGDERAVWLADSFEGFPAEGDPDADARGLAAVDFLSAPLDEVRETFARFGCERGVRFLPGLFQHTLASLAGRRWAIVRLDADTYGPTRHALRCLYPGLAVGGYVIVDDYDLFEECRRAVDEFRAEHGIAEPLERVDRMCVRWRRTSDAPIPAIEPPAAAPPTPRPPAGRPREQHVPTTREVDLEREVVALRARLAAEVGLRPWLRRRLGR
jgi:O-methyltransferase